MTYPYFNPWFSASPYYPPAGYGQAGPGAPGYPTPNPQYDFQQSAALPQSSGPGDMFGDPSYLLAMMFQGGFGDYGGYNSTPTGISPSDHSNANRDPAQYKVNTSLVEVGYYNNGEADKHAQAVKEIYQKNNPLGRNNVKFVGIGYDKPSDDSDSDEPTHLANKKELDSFIESESSDAFDIMTENVTKLVKAGNTDVINGSLGYSRNTVYENVMLSLTDNPNLASTFGLKSSDITSLDKNEDGQLLVTDKVANAVVRYVDGRIDREGSAYNNSKAKYQRATQYAAANGVTVVVAAGNEHELNSVFTGRKRGGDTNFLAQSNYVISVAAADNKGTPSPKDDSMAPFSSWGDGRYNPTVAANGVEVPTKSGKQDGTSFASPQVAATVARMKQINPNLTFEQIKAILQQSATDIVPNNSMADGAGMVNPDLAVRWSQQFSQTA